MSFPKAKIFLPQSFPLSIVCCNRGDSLQLVPDGSLIDYTGAERQKYRATCGLVLMLPRSPIDLKCLDFTRCMANLLVEITTAYLPCGRPRPFVLSIEFYRSSQLFADHYMASATPRLPLEQRWRCAGLFAHSFIYAIQIAALLLLIWDANKLVQGCCSGTEGRQTEQAMHPVPACFIFKLASSITHTHTLLPSYKMLI